MSQDTIIPEFLQNSQTLPSRMRSSDFDLSSEDGDVVIRLRQSKLGKRESIFGIRNIFARSSKKEGDSASTTTTTTTLTPTTSLTTTPAPSSSSSSSLSLSFRAPRSSGIRASIAEISHWPYGQQARSELALPMTSQPWESPQERPDSSHRFALPHGPPRRKSSSANATWTIPPLFKAHREAIRYDVLPAPTIATDVILRLNEKKNLLLSAETMAGNDVFGEHQAASDMEKLKRRLRGDGLAASSLQWTTKTYVLTPSGYLLQYLGEGCSDRLPEKVLRLGPSSAAFASDIIPGRHWVLQISSVTENDGTPLQAESRSIFSKLPFRSSDKRFTPNMLMVFERAEDMNEWITVLRGEIERLGKKSPSLEAGLSDKGISEVESSSRRQIFGHPSISESMAILEEEQESRLSMSSTTATDFDGGMQDSSLDDVSMTNSITSHDGRQLDALRENSHRFSMISSGQRTVMTSTNSSPAGSPVLERFPRISDSDFGDAIPSRRTSLQALSPFAEELRHDTIPENCPTSYVSASPVRNDVAIGNAPPRRPSYTKMAPSEPEASASSSSASSSSKGGLSLFPRSSLRKQLGAIRTSRPLSTVEDQPSPKENIPERPITSHHAGSRPSTPLDAPPLPRARLMAELMASSSGAAASGSPARRLPSFGALRKPTEMLSTRKESSKDAGEPSARQQSTAMKVSTTFPPQTTMSRNGSKQRRRSFLELSDATGQGYTSLSRASKRASFGSLCSDQSSLADMYGGGIVDFPPMLAPPPSKALPPIPQRPSTASAGKARAARKNSSPPMPEGPPPAPPPMCALPPIPQKQVAEE